MRVILSIGEIDNILLQKFSISENKTPPRPWARRCPCGERSAAATIAAAAAATAAAGAKGAAAGTVAAEQEQNDDQDDDPAVAAAKTVIIAHIKTSCEI